MTLEIVYPTLGQPCLTRARTLEIGLFKQTLAFVGTGAPSICAQLLLKSPYL